jgi:molybdenum cofactor cytidylyltransferase
LKSSKKPKIYGLLLSAGLSSRMGKFKPLINFNGKSFVQNIVLRLNSVCEKIIIVTGFNKTEVEDNLNQLKTANIEFVFNPEFEKGMSTSLKTGLKLAANSNWILYHFIDQPGLPEKFYTEFIQQIDDLHNWIQPSFKKEKGHPILIHKTVFDLIISASAERSLREISKNPVVKKKFWECDFEEILQDIDTDQDYRKL